MASYIPFVRSKGDCEILKKYYTDSYIIRMSLESIENIRENIPTKFAKWIDPAFDGFENWYKFKDSKDKHHNTKNWHSLYEKISEFEYFEKQGFKTKVIPYKVESFINSLMDKCFKYNPEWITIPQLPIVDDVSRNQINLSLAKATKKNLDKRNFKGKLVFPIIITKSEILERKTIRGNKIKSALNCYKNSNAKYIWIVDSSLSDQDGSRKNEFHFKNLVSFHEELKKSSPKNVQIIAGPYWGLNLILWTRKFCDFPAICLGSTYKYYLPGGIINEKAKIRIAIPPLKRMVAVDNVKEWLRCVLKELPNEDKSYKEFMRLNEAIDVLSNDAATSKEKISKFYKEWIDTIEKIPQDGRSLFMYQDFSSVYVLSKVIDQLLVNLYDRIQISQDTQFSQLLSKRRKIEKISHNANRIAQQYMLCCL
jgi:hypothetical protein